MRLYLIQNKLLARDHEGNVKAGREPTGEKGRTGAVQQQNLPVKYVYGRDDKEQIARPAKYQPVKPGERPLYVLVEFADKLWHGVSLFDARIQTIQLRTPSEKRQHCLRLAAMRQNGILRADGQSALRAAFACQRRLVHVY